MPLEIWIPPTARPAYRCMVNGCDRTFTEDELSAYIRHTTRHSQECEAEIAAEVEAQQSNAFTSSRSLDREREEHLRRRFQAGEKVDWLTEGAVH